MAIARTIGLGCVGRQEQKESQDSQALAEDHPGRRGAPGVARRNLAYTDRTSRPTGSPWTDARLPANRVHTSAQALRWQDDDPVLVAELIREATGPVRV